MRYMIIIRATPLSESGALPTEAELAEMGAAHEEMHRAGIVLDANGLQPSSKGFRVEFRNGKRTVLDGPFSETKELIAGYTIIDVKSKQEAVEWARRFPNPYRGMDGHIEVRQVFELDDFTQGPAIERWKAMDLSKGAH